LFGKLADFARLVILVYKILESSSYKRATVLVLGMSVWRTLFSMHQRTWFSIVTLPIVTAFTCPVVFNSVQDLPRVAIWNINRDSTVVISDIQEVLALINSTYVDKPDIEKIVDGGIQCVLNKTHPLNSYLTVGDLRLSDPGSAGIGIGVIKKTINALIISVVPGSPAARAGLKVGDIISQINDHPVFAMSNWSLERILRGHAGSDLKLLLINDTSNKKELKKITLRRECIRLPPIVLSGDSRANIVTLTDLNYGRALELKAKLEGLRRDIPLILNISQCAGGHLTEAASVAGLFIVDGPLATVQEVGKSPLSISVVPTGIHSFTDIVVVQSKYTIGAAEALSSALKRQFIMVFGDRTCGLGVERTRFLLRYGGAAEIVNKRWLGASGECLSFSTGDLENQGGEVLKDDLGKPILSPGRFGVLPNSAINIGDSEADWLPRVLEIIECKCKRNATNLPVSM
jgi:carboxyl-terminal processing protease